MKPSFTLNFSEDRIDLLHRASGGWIEVGSVPLDEPDLRAALAYLRGSALGLEPRGITTKLVIPNSQILYTSIEAPGPDAASRRRQIKAGLEGRTPYAVDDLVFDWSGTGDTVQVAVVARETLKEAESFAGDHRFNPISFVAIPASGQFAAEPWFGPTSLADAILVPGEKVDRDQDPIRIVRRAPFKPEPAPEPVEDGTPARSEDAHPAGPHTPKDPEATPDIPQMAPEASASPQADVISPIIPEPDISSDPEVQPDGGTEPSSPSTDEHPANPKPVAAAPAPQGKAPIKGAEPQVSFSSRRKGAPAIPDVEALGEATAHPDLAATDRQRMRTASSAEFDKGLAQGAIRLNGATPSVTAPSIAGPRLRQPPVPAPIDKPGADTRPPAPQMVQNEAHSMSIFGARKQSQRGKPRYLGLILTGILLAFLAIVAAWSSIYLASYFDGDAPAVATSQDPDAIADPASSEGAALDPTPDDEMLADLQDPEEFLASESGATSTTETVPVEEAAQLDASEDPDLPAASPAVETGGVAEANRNPTNDPQDEIFLAEIDPTPSTADAIALDKPKSFTDPLPPAQLAPPPFGTLYTFDADGLIVATPEGIITPEGVLLIAGRPAKIPPERPEVTAAGDVPAASASTLPEAEQVFRADPALADARPRARPAGLETDVQVIDDEAAVTVDTNLRISSLRPRARPETAVAAVEVEAAAVDQAEIDAALQAASASIVASAEMPASESSLAVAVSRKPAPRPAIPDKAVSDAVEAAVAAAAEPVVVDTPPAAEPTLALAPTKKDAPASSEPVDEPEVTSAAPDIPTRASVAKQATYRNAFNLSKTNLIGVYGTSANRYAMVRQSNGRFVKIEVGDRIDGGRVAAISEREVKYVKNGKTLTLAMPKG